MNKPSCLVLIGLAALAACGQKPGPTPSPTEGQVNAEDPKTGTNSGRPDSSRDLTPGTDGNTTPVTK